MLLLLLWLWTILSYIIGVKYSNIQLNTTKEVNLRREKSHTTKHNLKLQIHWHFVSIVNNRIKLQSQCWMGIFIYFWWCFIRFEVCFWVLSLTNSWLTDWLTAYPFGSIQPGLGWLSNGFLPSPHLNSSFIIGVNSSLRRGLNACERQGPGGRGGEGRAAGKRR